MPELPEVEVICRGLKPHLFDQRVIKITYSGQKLRHEFDVQNANKILSKKRIHSISRRAKYIVISLEDNNILLFHLGMTGTLGIFKKKSPPKKHDHITISLERNMQLRFNDVRRFGSIQLFSQASLETLEKSVFSNLGPEPLSKQFTPQHLNDAATRKTQSIKNYIMDNRIVVGIGNIYANESLFASSIHPARPANSISFSEWQKLHLNICKTLNWAIDCGGSTINDFLNASGESGYFQANFRVYGKAGARCGKCDELIEKTVIGGRATFFCPTCQK